MKKPSGWKQALTFSLAGFFATAVTYGPARMGFGLFLPEFRGEFALSTGTAGFIASTAFLGFLLALPVAASLTARRGPRAPILVGGLLAFSGMALVAASLNGVMLAAGIAVAGSSPGFCWTPYNNAAPKMAAADLRHHVLSAISTGTTIGVTAAGGLAALIAFSNHSWRLAWGAFAACAILMTIFNFFVLRNDADRLGARAADTATGPSEAGFKGLFEPKAIPLFALALSFGATSAIYLSFAADRVTAAGGLTGLPPRASSPAIFIAYGLIGLVGLIAGRLEERMGLVRLLRGIFLCSALSLALVARMPNSWPGVLMSAGLQGGCVMTISAIFAFWSLRIFPHLPATGFTGAILALAAGSIVGPGVAGLTLDHFGAEATFLGAGLLSLLTAVGVRSTIIR